MPNNGIIDKLKDKVNDTLKGLKQQYGLATFGEEWPQVKHTPLELYPNYKTRGWLPPNLIPVDKNDMTGKYPDYNYDYEFTDGNLKDWRGYNLKANLNNLTPLDGKLKFGSPSDLNVDESQIPLSTRKHYMIFNDTSTDYFKHGIQIVDNINTVQSIDYTSNLNNKDSRYKSGDIETPYEHNDPIIYGFEIIFDSISSPLLNGSIEDFIANYTNITEIATLRGVYENFKQQFEKFFKTNADLKINESYNDELIFTNLGNKFNPQNSTEHFNNGSKAYMNYYLKRISGLDKLIERNTPKEKKFLNDYNSDVITLSFNEDVSMSIGTLAHLYKLLYWSKPNGKGLVPENLLRFNCDIVVSEVRNFKRVQKSLDTGNLKEIRDNVSRYIYSLKECQFYFNTLPHSSDINLGGIAPFGEGEYSIQFDYKYSTHLMERFTPEGYVGYDSGSIWKTSNKRKKDTDAIEIPRFFTKGDNKLNQNINTELSDISDILESNRIQVINETENRLGKAKLIDRLTDRAIKSAQRELQTGVNKMTALLNKTLNKITNSVGITGVSPPRNIYTDSITNAASRIFYDVRGELINFIGDSVGGMLGGNFTKRTF